MTRDDVAKACGLESPIAYIERTGRGRTTAMLCDAVAVASEAKRVYILAHTQRYGSQLAQEAQRMARRCGANDATFEARSHDWDFEHGTRGLRDYAICSDHYYQRR